MRIFSGIQPTGAKHLGNYSGGFRQYVATQEEGDGFFCIVDLHSITVEYEPEALRQTTLDLAALLFAVGIDPDRSTVFCQSHVAAHAEAAWLLSAVASYGQLGRMTQFKEKGERAEFTSAALLTYPALQAADILLYDTDRVPVGDDQRQHLELARDAAARFNSRYGDVLVVPEAAIAKVAARVMDLQDPTAKMSKSALSPQGTIDLFDTPDELARKVKRAVTDTDGEVRYDRAAKPGVSNLLELLSAATGDAPEVLAGRYARYGPLKADVADALNELLAPFRQRFSELQADPGAVEAVLTLGRDKADAVAEATLGRVRHALGLLPR